jgi:hypothetical protein
MPHKPGWGATLRHFGDIQRQRAVRLSQPALETRLCVSGTEEVAFYVRVFSLLSEVPIADGLLHDRRVTLVLINNGVQGVTPCHARRQLQPIQHLAEQ